MDAIDARIVRALQRDGRLTNLELAEEVGLSPSPCLRRVKNLEAAGIIQGYSALVDQKACGFPITCLVR
ncbi:MAG: AsnC family transcriptional regulator, partial [Hyphomonas sp. 34-62-18]